MMIDEEKASTNPPNSVLCIPPINEDVMILFRSDTARLAASNGVLASAVPG